MEWTKTDSDVVMLTCDYKSANFSEQNHVSVILLHGQYKFALKGMSELITCYWITVRLLKVPWLKT